MKTVADQEVDTKIALATRSRQGRQAWLRTVHLHKYDSNTISTRFFSGQLIYSPTKKSP